MKKLLFFAIAIIGFSATSFGQVQTATATASAAIVIPLDIQNKSNMNFGSIVATQAGTVVLEASSSGTRTPSTGLTLPGTVFSAASFEVTGAPGTTYNFTIPTAAISTTTKPTGATAMTIDGFTSLPATTAGSGTGTLGVSTGKQIIYVGATLNVGDAQTPGQYSTDGFNVTVNYN